MKLKYRLLIAPVLLALWATVSGVVGAGAWFSDVAAESGSVVATGSVALEITGGPLRAELLVPGGDYSEMGVICTSNSGEADLQYRGMFETSADSSKEFLSYLAMKVEDDGNGDWSIEREIPARPANETEGLPAYFKFAGQNPFVLNNYLLQGTLTPGETRCYRFWIRLDGSTPNDFQGASLDYVLSINATQAEAAGW
jgi:hypothetical protein